MSMIHLIAADPTIDRTKAPKRKGRGRSSGMGKTAGRGTKGAKARVGTYVKLGHEHGQTPIYRRLPKRGFSNDDFARRFHVVNVEELERFAADTTVDARALRDAGLIPNLHLPVKILGEGTLGRKLTVVAAGYSKSAFEKITAAGGAAQNLAGEPFVFPKPKKRFVKRPKAPKGETTEAAPAGEAAAAAKAAGAPASE